MSIHFLFYRFQTCFLFFLHLWKRSNFTFASFFSTWVTTHQLDLESCQWNCGWPSHEAQDLGLAVSFAANLEEAPANYLSCVHRSIGLQPTRSSYGEWWWDPITLDLCAVKLLLGAIVSILIQGANCCSFQNGSLPYQVISIGAS